MRKKLWAILLAAVMMLSALPAFADYVPLRAVFEKKGYTVLWSADQPDDVFVEIDGYSLNFQDGSNEVTSEEGVFHTEQAAYIENGTTYISEDAVSLCDNLYLYHNAILDCIQAEEDERLPLFPIDTSEEQVLVCTWHKYPDSYPDGEEIDIKYGHVWVFTTDEIYDFGRKNGQSDDMVLRMEQLIGLPPQAGKTHFTLLWVNPEDLYRPAPDAEIDDTIAELTFPETASEEYVEWFQGNMAASYEPHKYPWTRLGYTYDWADNGTEYGLSEYVLKNGSKATVEKTYTNEEFFEEITSLDYSDPSN